MWIVLDHAFCDTVYILAMNIKCNFIFIPTETAGLHEYYSCLCHGAYWMAYIMENICRLLG